MLLAQHKYVFVVLLKCKCPPLSGHAGISPATRLGTFLYKIFRRSRGRQRHSHRRVSFTYYATRSPTKRTTLVGSLVLIVKLGTYSLTALRFEFHLRITHCVYKYAPNECALLLVRSTSSRTAVSFHLRITHCVYKYAPNECALLLVRSTSSRTAVSFHLRITHCVYKYAPNECALLLVRSTSSRTAVSFHLRIAHCVYKYAPNECAFG